MCTHENMRVAFPAKCWGCCFCFFLFPFSFPQNKTLENGDSKKKKKKIGEKEDYAYVEFAQFYEAKEWIDGNRPTPLVCGTPVHLDYESTDWRCNHVR